MITARKGVKTFASTSRGCLEERFHGVFENRFLKSLSVSTVSAPLHEGGGEENYRGRKTRPVRASGSMNEIGGGDIRGEAKSNQVPLLEERDVGGDLVQVDESEWIPRLGLVTGVLTREKNCICHRDQIFLCFPCPPAGLAGRYGRKDGGMSMEDSEVFF